MNYQSLLETHLAQFARKRPTPRIACAICRDGEILATSSSVAPGFAELSEPAQTSFRIASMTKSFAAAAVLGLRDEGKLRIEKSVADYLPEMNLSDRWRNVSVRHLLSMRAGLAAADDPWADRKLSEPDSFVNSALLNSAHFSNYPDEEYQYSNLGYMILGRIISNVSRTHALEYVSKRFLEPLGMKQTSWNLPASDAAGGYKATPGGFESETGFRSQSDLAVFGGLCSTLRDLTTWIHFLAGGHKRQPSPFEKVLSARSRREMQRAKVVMHPIDSTDVDNRPIGYGYGLRASYVGKEWFVGHSGGLPGYGSHMSWSTTRGIGVVALGNVTYFPALELCRELLLAIQEQSSRSVAALAHGEEIVLSRGKALLEAATSNASELPAALFSYNFPQDQDMETLYGRLRDVLEQSMSKTLEVKAERGFAGAIYAGDEPLVFYSLAPVDGYLIQKVSFHDQPV